jgi:hypothetical protein
VESEPARLELTFIVRVSRGDGGRLAGIVERVRTGEKHRFRGVGGMPAPIAGMLAAAGTECEESRTIS